MSNIYKVGRLSDPLQLCSLDSLGSNQGGSKRGARERNDDNNRILNELLTMVVELLTKLKSVEGEKGEGQRC